MKNEKQKWNCFKRKMIQALERLKHIEITHIDKHRETQ